MFQPSAMAMFAKRSPKAQKAAVEDDVDEVEIVGATRDRNSESDFSNWLRKDLKSEQKKRVNWNQGKRFVYDKHGFNPNHIPHQGNYPKDKKKEKLEQWDNPKFNWPPKLPKATMYSGRTLLNHIDAEERQKIQRDREFSLPNLRTGDVVELSMFQSVSSAKI
mmetsp:Transcript_12343/g.15744  ORF Transcript_12343/g.15744 Transcript_12343/m.15744 type:complete len:163 (+) Transcript_12343:112-600(+)